MNKYFQVLECSSLLGISQNYATASRCKNTATKCKTKGSMMRFFRTPAKPTWIWANRILWTEVRIIISINFQTEPRSRGGHKGHLRNEETRGSYQGYLRVQGLRMSPANLVQASSRVNQRSLASSIATLSLKSAVTSTRTRLLTPAGRKTP